jgi:hypothetical protein
MVVLRSDGATHDWRIIVQADHLNHVYGLVLVGGDGRRWTAEAFDVFEALLQIRRDVEVLGLRLCCNGARRDAWSSGMQRDMVGGQSVYLLDSVPSGRRPLQVETLGTTPPASSVLVAEQEAWHQEWIDTGRSHRPPVSGWRRLLPSPLRSIATKANAKDWEP